MPRLLVHFNNPYILEGYGIHFLDSLSSDWVVDVVTTNYFFPKAFDHQIRALMDEGRVEVFSKIDAWQVGAATGEPYPTWLRQYQGLRQLCHRLKSTQYEAAVFHSTCHGFDCAPLLELLKGPNRPLFLGLMLSPYKPVASEHEKEPITKRVTSLARHSLQLAQAYLMPCVICHRLPRREWLRPPIGLFPFDGLLTTDSESIRRLKRDFVQTPILRITAQDALSTESRTESHALGVCLSTPPRASEIAEFSAALQTDLLKLDLSVYETILVRAHPRHSGPWLERVLTRMPLIDKPFIISPADEGLGSFVKRVKAAAVAYSGVVGAIHHIDSKLPLFPLTQVSLQTRYPFPDRYLEIVESESVDLDTGRRQSPPAFTLQEAIEWLHDKRTPHHEGNFPEIDHCGPP